MIQKAKILNLNSLLMIENSEFSEFDFRLSRRNFKYHIQKEHIYIYLLDNTICGYLLFLEYKNTIRIYSVVVLEKFTGRGYAKELMSYVIEYAMQKNKNISLEVKYDNHKAISLYKKLGFIEKEILNSYYLDGKNGIKMVLSSKK